LHLIPGSSRAELEPHQFDEQKFFRHDCIDNAPLIHSAIAAELDPGDVLFFHCRTLHAATRNRSSDTKYSVVFTFRSKDNPPLPGTRSSSMPELIVPAE